MKRAPREVSWTELGSQRESALRRAGQAGTVLVTRRGRPSAVLMSLETFERIERETAILKTLVRGELDIRHGRTHDGPAALRALRRRIQGRSKRLA